VDKEVVARVARDAKRPEDFQDRAIMRDHTQRVLSNMFYQRMVVDSVTVNPGDVERMMAQLASAAHSRARVQDQRSRRSCPDPRSSQARLPGPQRDKLKDLAASRDLGWIGRTRFTPQVGTSLFALPVGSISPVLKDSTWFSVYKVLDQREQGKAVRASATQELRNQEIAKRAEQVSARYRKEINMTIDSSNVAWVAKQFPHQSGRHREPGGHRCFGAEDLLLPTPRGSWRASSAGRVTVGRLWSTTGLFPTCSAPAWTLRKRCVRPST
jgi:hypothetical protein